MRAIRSAQSLLYDSNTLGSLFVDPRNPQQDAKPPPVRLTDDDFYVIPKSAIRISKKQSSACGTETFLSRFLKFSSDSGDETQVYHQATQCYTYTLRNPRKLYKNLCKHPDVRIWIQEQIEDGFHVYFVTEITTLIDATANHARSHTMRLEGTAGIPVQEAITGIPLPIGELLDVSQGAAKEKSKNNAISYTAPGEQIFEIEYRRAKFRFFKSRAIEHSRLAEPNVWRADSDFRRAVDDDEAETQADEFVEADLYSDVDFSDNDEQSLEHGPTEDGKSWLIVSSDKMVDHLS